MLKEFTAYTAICDGCNENLLAESELSAMDLDDIEEELRQADWNELKILQKGKTIIKHYCSGCYDKLIHKVKN